jgi:hypothetical protein
MGHDAHQQFMDDLSLWHSTQSERLEDRIKLLLGVIALWHSPEISLSNDESDIFAKLLRIARASRYSGEGGSSEAIVGAGCPAAYNRDKMGGPIQLALQLLAESL